MEMDGDDNDMSDNDALSTENPVRKETGERFFFQTCFIFLFHLQSIILLPETKN